MKHQSKSYIIEKMLKRGIRRHLEERKKESLKDVLRRLIDSREYIVESVFRLTDSVHYTSAKAKMLPSQDIH